MNRSKAVVLVVEDDPLTLIHSTMALEDAGYEVVAASTGEEALAAVARRDDIDTLFSDVELSGPVDGVALAAAVRRAAPDTSIVLTSGKQALDDDDLPEGGRFLAKPYTAAQLRRALAEC